MFDDWPAPARRLAAALELALGAAVRGDADGFDRTRAELAAVERSHRGALGVLLAAVTSDLLERYAADGLDAETAEVVLHGVAIGARGWFASFDDLVLLRALGDALGIAADPDAPVPDAGDLLAHGLVLDAWLLHVTRARPVDVITTGLRELAREQTIELP